MEDFFVVEDLLGVPFFIPMKNKRPPNNAKLYKNQPAISTHSRVHKTTNRNHKLINRIVEKKERKGIIIKRSAIFLTCANLIKS